MVSVLLHYYILPPHMCYHAEFVRSALKDVYRKKYRGKKQNLGVLKFCCLGTGRVADRKIHALPYMVKFGSSALNGVCKNRREPPKLGSVEARSLAEGARG